MNDSSGDGAKHVPDRPASRRSLLRDRAARLAAPAEPGSIRDRNEKAVSSLPTDYVTMTAEDVFERSNVVAVRLNAEEQRSWKAAAADDGRKQVGRWVRELVNRQLDDRPTGLDQIEDLADLRLNLTRAGSNLNQIARALNIAALGAGDQPELATIAQAIEDMRIAIGEVRDALHEVGR